MGHARMSFSGPILGSVLTKGLIQRYGQDSVTVMSAYAAIFLIKVSPLARSSLPLTRRPTASETKGHVRAHRGLSTENLRYNQASSGCLPGGRAIGPIILIGHVPRAFLEGARC
jgi:hypothetical protein